MKKFQLPALPKPPKAATGSGAANPAAGKNAKSPASGKQVKPVQQPKAAARKPAGPKVKATAKVTATATGSMAKTKTKRASRKAAATAPTPALTPVVLPTITAVHLPLTKWQRLSAWLKGLFGGKQTAPAATASATTTATPGATPAATQATPPAATGTPVTPGTPASTQPSATPAPQPAKRSIWLWVFLVLAMLATTGVVIYKVMRKGSSTTSGVRQFVVGTTNATALAATATNATAKAVANTNAVSAAATNTAPSLAPSAPTNVPPVVPPISVKIEGDGNNGNNMVVNFGTISVTETIGNAWASVDGGVAKARNFPAGQTAAAPSGMWFPNGCLTWMKVFVPPSEWDKDSYTVTVKADRKQYVMAPKAPPGWSFNYSFKADGPLEKYFDNKPVEEDGQFPPGDWGFYMSPSAEQCTLELFFKRVLKK